MPGGFKFHEVHTLARDGVGNDDHRIFPNGLCVSAGIDKLPYVVPIDFNNREVKCFELIYQWLERHDIFCIAIDLDVIAINDPGKIVKIVFASKQRRFPGDARLELAVTHHAIRVPR